MRHRSLTGSAPTVIGTNVVRPKTEPAAEAALTAPPASLAAELVLGAIRRKAAQLEVGGAEDPVEHEADALAEKMLESEESPCGCAVGGGACKCGSAGGGTIRRRATGSPTAPAPAGLGLAGGAPLPSADRRFFEMRSGLDLSGVRIHDDAATGAATRDIGALAFTRGNAIGFAAGQYQPGTPSGRSLLAHELAHVVLGHSGVRRRYDVESRSQYERYERLAREAAERERRHRAWLARVEQHRLRQLPEQSATIEAERDRTALASLAQKSASIDAVAGGQGWLQAALTSQGYAGPSLPELKLAWGNALVAAEAVRPGRPGEAPSTAARLVALEAIPTFYDALAVFAAAAEPAHRNYVTTTNDRLRADYTARRQRYDEIQEMDRETVRMLRGEPGAGAFAGGLALSRGAPPPAPDYLTEPPAISGRIAPARALVYAADSAEQWANVLRDVESLADGFAKLVVQSLPVQSELRRGAEYLEQLDERLAKFEQENPTGVRIPAIYYPKDKIVPPRAGAPADQPTVVEAIPWQLYLINTRLTPPWQPLRPAGEWQLIDLTSAQRFVNTVAASEADTLRLQRGEKVDPPVDLFTELNSKIRFPEGVLHFQMPTGSTYVHEMTEPWEWSDFLTAVGLALAAIAIVAAVIATGGAAAPAAVAFYAGLGAAAAGIGSTLAGLHEKRLQGVLTGKDVDEAMISIGIDLVGALSLGLSRLVALPSAAARLGITGSRFIVLQRVALASKVVVLGGDVYQAWSFTSSFLTALRALEDQPGMTDAEREERKKLRGQLVRRALLTGALLAVALKGDVADVQAGRTIRVARVDPDGSLVLAPHADTGVTPGAHPVGPHTGVAPHARVSGPVHQAADRTGAALRIGSRNHGIGVAGEGRMRDLYFCSDACTTIVNQLDAIVDALPRRHPERAIFQGLLSRARGASRRLKAGKLTPEAADEIAREITADLTRHSQRSELFGALLNTDPSLLRSRGNEIRQRLARDMRAQQSALSGQAERQWAERRNVGRVDPETGLPIRSPIELDVLGGLGVQEAARPSRRAQPLHFDTGIFSHTYAEALVPGLPRGLNAEVSVTLPNGQPGRADRVRFLTDADGTVIGAHVYEIKPDTPDNVARGQVQADQYAAALRARIEGELRAAGRPIPTVAPDGGPLYATRVMTYNQDQMMAVLRAIRSAHADAPQMAGLEAIARAVFGAAVP